MRIAALVVGILGGIVGLILGFTSYSLLAVAGNGSSAVVVYQVVAIGAPVLTLIGGGLALSRPIPAAILMIIGAVGMAYVFGFSSWTAIPIVLAVVGAILAFLGAGHAHRRMA